MKLLLISILTELLLLTGQGLVKLLQKILRLQLQFTEGTGASDTR